MADKEKRERPEARDDVISARVPKDVHRKAKARAKREGRNLSAILRAWLFLFAEDEAPSPPTLPGEDTRAKKRKQEKNDD